MYLATGEERWRREAAAIIDRFLAWASEYGALLAPYTSHSMPRVPFMNLLTVNSFARYLLIEPERETVKKLIVDAVDDVVEHCLGPDGMFYYKELPSLRRAAPRRAAPRRTAPTPHALEALTYAYRLTGDQSSTVRPHETTGRAAPTTAIGGVHQSLKGAAWPIVVATSRVSRLAGGCEEAALSGSRMPGVYCLLP